VGTFQNRELYQSRVNFAGGAQPGAPGRGRPAGNACRRKRNGGKQHDPARRLPSGSGNILPPRTKSGHATHRPNATTHSPYRHTAVRHRRFERAGCATLPISQPPHRTGEVRR